jgi:hypothetical protein
MPKDDLCSLHPFCQNTDNEGMTAAGRHYDEASIKNFFLEIGNFVSKSTPLKI